MAQSPGSCRSLQRTAGDLEWQKTAAWPSAEIWDCERLDEGTHQGSLSLEVEELRVVGGHPVWYVRVAYRDPWHFEIVVSIAVVKDSHWHWFAATRRPEVIHFGWDLAIWGDMGDWDCWWCKFNYMQLQSDVMAINGYVDQGTSTSNGSTNVLLFINIAITFSH